MQLARPSELESIKDQMVNLKRLCRIRTVKAIKQAHLQALDDLLGKLDTSKAALHQELVAMRVSRRRAWHGPLPADARCPSRC